MVCEDVHRDRNLLGLGECEHVTSIYAFYCSTCLPSIFVHTDAGSSVKPELIAGVVASVSVLLICLVGMLVWFVAKKRFHNQMPSVLDWTSVNPDYISGADGTLPVFLFVLYEKVLTVLICAQIRCTQAC